MIFHCYYFKIVLATLHAAHLAFNVGTDRVSKHCRGQAHVAPLNVSHEGVPPLVPVYATEISVQFNAI